MKRRIILFLYIFIVSLVFVLKLFAQPASEGEANELFNKAMSTRNSSERIVFLKQVLELKPDFFRAHLELGKQYLRLNQYSSAKRYLLNAIGLDPQNAEAYAWLGQVYISMNQIQQAVTFFQQALKWQPENQIAHQGLKQVQKQQALQKFSAQIEKAIKNSNWNQAFELFKSFSAQAPQAPSIKSLRQRIAQNYYEKGNALFQARNWNQALALYNKVWEIFPRYLDTEQKLQVAELNLAQQNSIESLYRQGVHAIRLKDWDAAVSHLRNVIKMSKNFKNVQALWREALAGRQMAQEEAHAKQIPPVDTTREQTAPGSDTIQKTDSLPTAADDSSKIALPPAVTPSTGFTINHKQWKYLLASSLVVFVLILLFRRDRKKSKASKQPPQRRRSLSQPKPAAKLTIPKIVKAPGTSPEVAMKVVEQPKAARLEMPKIKGRPAPTRSRRFELQELITEYENVQIFTAFDRRLKRKVTIDRILFNSKSDSSRSNRQALIEGVQRAANLNHPHIFKVDDVFFQHNYLYIVLEYIPNSTLRQKIITHKKLEIPAAAKIVQQICFALDYAHRNGVIHFDLRPFHIKLVTDELVKIAGFELSSLNSSSRTVPSESSPVPPVFLSPEQIRNDDIDMRTDIYSLGVVFYELVTGILPFSGEFQSSLIFRILEGNPQPPKQVNASIPDSLNDLILKMMAKNPAARFYNALDIGLDLKKFL